MSGKRLRRRDFLRGLAAAAGGTVLAACAPRVVEKVVDRPVVQTVVVEKAVEVEKLATVIVEKAVSVEKKVVETVVVEKPVEVEKRVVETVIVTQEKVVTVQPAMEGPRAIVWSTWAGGDAEVNLKQATVEEFNNTRGAALDIELSARITTDYAGYWTKIPASFAGGDAPDAIWSFPTSWVKWIYAGWIRDLTPFVDLEPEVSAIRQALRQVPKNSYDFLGKVYGIPHLVQLYGCQFNKEMFDEAGLDYPPADWDDPDWTVEKFTELAIALTKRSSDGQAEQLGATTATDLTAWMGQAFVEGNGGDLFDEGWTKCYLDEEPAVEVGQWGYDLFNKHKVSPTPEEGAAGFSFWNGNVAMMLSLITWPARLIEGSYGVWTPELAPLPKWKETKEWSHGIPICCSSQSPHPEAVVEFARWMVEFGDDMNVALGYCAPLLDKHKDLLMTHAPGMDYVTEELLKMRREPHLQALNYAGLKVNPFFPKWNELNRDVWGPKVNDVMISGDEDDFGTVISAAMPEIDALLAEAQQDIADFRSGKIPD